MPERLDSRRGHAPARPQPRPVTDRRPGTPDAAPVLRLQRSAGNRAVTALLAGTAAQRVAVTDKPFSETLYNQKGAGGKAKAKDYSITPKYVLARNGDTGLTVTVRVKFLHQVRDATGALVGSPVEIPVNDPDDRRGWAQKLVKEQVKPWNGHVTLTGEEVNVFSKNTAKRLPVTFESVAVFGLGDDYDNIVIIHPSSVQAGTPGQQIDAGNYYLNKGPNYPGDEKIIAAHEYGHLIGIPDEYSQSNEQLNALLHQAAPTTAPSARAALDKKTVERMVLAALRDPLYLALGAAMPSVTDALRAKRAAVKKQLAAAARAGAKDAAVRAELEKQLVASAEPGLAPAVPRTVAFQTTRNFSNKDLAGKTVEAGFSAAALSTLIQDRYWKALLGAEDANVAVEGLGDVSINVKQSVRDTAKTGGAQAADAASAVATSVGGPGGPVNVFGFVLQAPPSGLVGRLMGIPATWGAAGSALESGVTAGAFAGRMAAILKAAGAAAAFLAAVPGLAGPKTATVHALYARAHSMVNTAAAAAAGELSAELLNTVIPPVITADVTDLQTLIHTEVEKLMGTPPAGLAGMGDPAMGRIAAAMKARLDADKAASAGGGRDPLGTSKPAPDQDVTYSYQGLMGTNATVAIRQDQLAPLVAQFNAHCLTLWERSFRAEVT